MPESLQQIVRRHLGQVLQHYLITDPKARPELPAQPVEVLSVTGRAEGNGVVILVKTTTGTLAYEVRARGVY